MVAGRRRIVGLLAVLALVGCSTPSSSGSSSESASTAETAAAESASAAPSAAALPDKIGFSVLGRGGNHWVRMIEEVTAAAEALGIEVAISDPQYDAVAQVDQVQDLVNGGADVVIIASLDAEGIQSAVEYAQDRGVKVIGYISGFEGADAYLNISECGWGEAAGIYAGEWWAENREGIAAKAWEANADSLGGDLPERTDCMVEGFRSVVPDLEVVADIEAWLEETGNTIMGDVLSANADLNVVFGSDNEVVYGAISALESRNKVAGTDVVFLSVDGQERMLELIRDGKVLVTGAIPEDVAGPALVDLAVEAFAGNVSSGEAREVETTTITSENVEEALAKLAD